MKKKSLLATIDGIPCESNILGVTGMSRAALANMFQRDGVFGRDSSLPMTDQVVVMSRLPKYEGLSRPSIVPKGNGRTIAIAALCDALICQIEEAVHENHQIVLEMGVGSDQVLEIATVIEHVRVVFGLSKNGCDQKSPIERESLMKAA